MTEENNDGTVESTEVTTPEATQSVQAPKATAKIEPATETPIDFDKRLYTEDGKFNKDGAKEYVREIEEDKKKYEERILGLRKVVSRNGEVVKQADEYFQDYAPAERFNKYFSEETPKETKEYLQKMTGDLSKRYLDIGLNKQQAFEVSNAILEVMEQVGVLDTRTEEQRYIDDQKYIQEQKQRLGANAENIIREAETFILSSNEFDARQKNKMLDMIKGGDMALVSIMHSIKDSFGSRTGGVPSNITNLGGLPSDKDLWMEYQTANPLRRDEIIAQRAKAGRTGKLSDAGNI